MRTFRRAGTRASLPLTLALLAPLAADAAPVTMEPLECGGFDLIIFPEPACTVPQLLEGAYDGGTVEVSVDTSGSLDEIDAPGDATGASWEYIIDESPATITYTFSTPVAIRSLVLHDIDDGSWDDTFEMDLGFSACSSSSGTVTCNATSSSGTPGSSGAEHEFLNAIEAVSTLEIRFDVATAVVGFDMDVEVAECGDGIQVVTEACDDGNLMDGDGCDSSCELEPGYACSDDVDLRRARTDAIGSADWSATSADVATVQDNSDPTVLVTSTDAYAGPFSVALRSDDTDDDFMGLALGIDEGELEGNTDFLLLDWKQSTQANFGGTGEQGLALNLVSGSGVTDADLWRHDGPVQELARAATLGSTGWSRSTSYTFDVDYGPQRLVVSVNGVVQFDVVPADVGLATFPAGKVGLYSFSQPDASFTWISPTAAQCASVCGDGVETVEEACDDGNGVEGDGCDTECEVELVPPDPLQVTVDVQTVSSDQPVITGTWDPSGATDFTVVVDGVVYLLGDPELALNPDGTWSLDLAASGQVLTDGVYDVAVTQTSPGGSTSDSTVDELTVDVLPAIPSVDPLTSPDPEPTLTGRWDASQGVEVTVTVDGQTYGAGEVILDPSGTWSLDLTGSPLAEGVYDVEVRVVDAEGNEQFDTTSDELVIDFAAPTAPTVAPVVSSSPTPQLSGTYDPADTSTLTVTVAGMTYTSGVDPELVLDPGTGTWSVSVPTPLADGTYDVEVVATDSVGNTSTDTTSDELTIDTLGPAAPTVSAVESSDGQPVIQGTYTPSNTSTFTVTVDGTTYTLGVDAELTASGSSWTLDLSGAAPLADGVYDVDAVATDAAGNGTADGTSDELLVARDQDGDGISDADETVIGTDPTTADTDGDGLSDLEELLGADGIAGTGDETLPGDADSDDDGLSDGEEVLGLDGLANSGDETDAVAADTDGDGVLDGTEVGRTTPVAGGTSPGGVDVDGTDPATFVPDADPTTTTIPWIEDTDGDGLLDGEEDVDGDGAWTGTIGDTGSSGTGETDPNLEDTDGDGLDDGEERLGADGVPSSGDETDPVDSDTDDGGVSDGGEVLVSGTDPLDGSDDLIDTDGDGLSDFEEATLGTDPLLEDTDGDGLTDGEEVLDHNTDPLDVDTDGGGALDGSEIADGTDPLDPDDDVPSPDTDGDGLSDDTEALLGTDPNNEDTDGDGLTDGEEVLEYDTDPTLEDSDGGGVLDGDEIDDGTDPNDPSDDMPIGPTPTGDTSDTGDTGDTGITSGTGDTGVGTTGDTGPGTEPPTTGDTGTTTDEPTPPDTGEPTGTTDTPAVDAGGGEYLGGCANGCSSTDGTPGLLMALFGLGWLRRRTGTKGGEA